MRVWLLAAMAATMLASAGAQAASGPKIGPSDDWTRMQKFEYFLGVLSGDLGLCRYHGLSNEVKELSDLSPYGRRGWASVQPFDSIRGGVCQRVAEQAREVLADRDKILAYLNETYDCPGGDCAQEDGDTSLWAPCRAEADEHLAGLPIDGRDIKSVRMVSRNAGATRLTTGKAGHEAWVRLSSCQGWLIIELSKGCYPRQTFTRGDCEIEGVSSY